MFGQQATIVVDLGFGDSGKGTIVDYLVRTSPRSTVVRFNGGAQAAHNVHTPDGRHHTFAQFGSGTFVPGVRTHLSRFMLIDPPALLNEAKHLAQLGVHDALARMSIDRLARVVTPFHKAANRIREALRGSGRHGSVGMGVGETMADSIAFAHQAVITADLRSPETLVEKFRFFQKLKYDEFHTQLGALARDAGLAEEVRILTEDDAPEKLAIAFWRFGMSLRIVDGAYLSTLAREGDLVFEGAQGVLIDEWHGFHPFTTWSTTTFDNAIALLGEIGFTGRVHKLGVLRAYATRHGAGPFPTEQSYLSTLLPDTHNTFDRWQEGFRVGWLDAVLKRYAIRACGGIHALVLTNLDRIASLTGLKIATTYGLADVSRDEQKTIVTKSTSEDTIQIVESFKRKPFLTDLGYQEILTGIVSRARPIYERVSGGDEFIQTVEDLLSVPVTIASYGPTAGDKRIRTRLRAAA